MNVIATADGVLADMLEAWSAQLPRGTSHVLAPYWHIVQGTSKTAMHSAKRSLLAFDWLLRQHLPTLLDRTPELFVHAESLRGLPSILVDLSEGAREAAMEAVLAAKQATSAGVELRRCGPDKKIVDGEPTWVDRPDAGPVERRAAHAARMAVDQRVQDGGSPAWAAWNAPFDGDRIARSYEGSSIRSFLDQPARSQQWPLSHAWGGFVETLDQYMSSIWSSASWIAALEASRGCGSDAEAQSKADAELISLRDEAHSELHSLFARMFVTEVLEDDLIALIRRNGKAAA